MDKDKINKINKFAICLFCKTFLMIDSISISDTDSIYLCYHCECGINRRMRLDKYLYGLNFIHNINLSLRSIHLCLDCFKTAYCDDKHHKNHTKIRKYYTLRNYEDCSSHQIFKEYVCLQCKIDICDECLKTTHKDHQHLTIRNYYDDIVAKTGQKELFYRYNKDRKHNAAIMAAMFDTSDTIRMYCGSMSVFRKGFVENIGEKDNEIIQLLWEKIQDFSKKPNASLDIIVENYPKEGFHDFHEQQLFVEMQNRGILTVSCLPDDLGFKETIPHFAFSSSCIVREEQDKNSHSALCTINDKEFLNDSQKLFHIIKDLSNKVALR